MGNKTPRVREARGAGVPEADPLPGFAENGRASLAGEHLPTAVELMAGMPFFEGSMHSDMAEWGREHAREIRKRGDLDGALHHLRLLDRLVMNPGEGAVERLLAGIDPELGWHESETRQSLLRARVYLAHFLVPEHMVFVAGELAALSLSHPGAGSRVFIRKAFAWTALCHEIQQRGLRGAVTDFPAFERAFELKFGGAAPACRGTAH
ncbi:hypothetical protein [Tianweitania sediminis]|uniref:Uncharacterized protein n=1 Tax=Tianweitania sediminis TaxID=1502156 RepID=A0A8J7QWM9_9HYPH|nr:hypothetical protein [Tianweitania sediminis]MBP0437978.1 hypothetical protein [Tianweitania sediminis]